MRAVHFHRNGGPEVLSIDSIEEPRPGPGEVLLEVKASSVNHLDLWMRRGLPGLPPAFPHVPGCDAAGVVAALGSGVSGLSPGDRVLADPGLSCGRCESCEQGEQSLCPSFAILGEHRSGAWAERIVLPAANLFPIPGQLSFEQAGAIPLAFLTAWRLVATRARVRPGEDVLVLGAGSGVGCAAIQIARLLGARVFATASTEDKRRRALELGAEVAIDYTDGDFSAEIRRLTAKRGVDVVVDHVGAETWPRSIKALGRNGRLVTCGATSGFEASTDLRHVFFRQLQILGSTMGSRGDMRAMLRAFERGLLRPVIDSSFRFDQAAEAMARLESRAVFGKVVITP